MRIRLRKVGSSWQEKTIRFVRPFFYHRAEWGKVQITRILVVLCSGIVSLTNVASRSSLRYVWLNLEPASSDESTIFADYQSAPPQVFHSLSLAPLADSSFNISPEEMQKLRQEGEKATVIHQALSGISNPTPEEFASSQEDVFLYTVEEGDTLGSIALKYNISSNTIRWANDLGDSDMIRPGDQLFILPVSGIRYVVKNGDNIDSLAKKFGGQKEEIITFNNLPANGDLTAGVEIIIPDGSSPDTSARIAGGQTTSPSGTTGTTTPGTTAGNTERTFNKQYYASGSHSFPWGWCTWYVASRRHVPWGGNAGTWLYHAKAYGANTGRTPKVGAIMVSGESRWGHVAIVESVKGDTITISEMNYRGFGVVSKRTISGKSGFIRGFIY